MIIKIINKIRYRKDKIKYYRKLGVKIGENCRLIGENSFGSEPYLVSLGDHVSVTTSKFITHDGGVWVFRDKHPEIDVIKPIKVGKNVFIGSDCIILPGVTIGDNVIVGARSVVSRKLQSNGVYAGVPARFIKSIEDYWKGIEPNVMYTKNMSISKKKEYLIKFFKKD